MLHDKLYRAVYVIWGQYMERAYSFFVRIFCHEEKIGLVAIGLFVIFANVKSN